MSSTTDRPLKRLILISVGSLCVALGTIGIFVPLLPTTCFLLAAGWCFARSSPRLSRWLHENRLFGSYLESYRTHRVIPARVKFVSIAALWGSIALSILVVSPPAWVVVILLGIAGAVTWHVVMLRTVEAAS